ANARDAVVLREALVHERVVGGQQIQHAAIFVEQAGEQELGFFTEGLTQVVIEVRELIDDRRVPRESAQAEPLSREVARQRRRTRIREHAANLPLQHGWL